MILCVPLSWYWFASDELRDGLTRFLPSDQTILSDGAGGSHPAESVAAIPLRTLLVPRDSGSWVLGGPLVADATTEPRDSRAWKGAPYEAPCAFIGVWSAADPASYLLLDEISKLTPLAGAKGCSVFTILLGLGQSVAEVRQSLVAWNVTVPTFFDGEFRLWSQLALNGRAEILHLDLNKSAILGRWDLSVWNAAEAFQHVPESTGGTGPAASPEPVDLAGTLFGQTSFPVFAVEGPDTSYVLDTVANQIQRVSPTGELTSFAGDGSPGSTGGDRLNAQFRLPIRAAWFKEDGSLIVADIGNRALRRIDLAQGVVSSIPVPERFIPTQVVDTQSGLLVYSSINNELFINRSGRFDRAEAFEPLPLPDPTFFPSGIAASSEFSVVYLYDDRTKRLVAFDLGQAEYRQLRTFNEMRGHWKLVALVGERLAFLSKSGDSTVVLYDVRGDAVLSVPISGRWSPATFLSSRTVPNQGLMLVDPMQSQYCFVPLDGMEMPQLTPENCGAWVPQQAVVPSDGVSTLNEELTLKQSVTNRLRVSLRPPNGWRFSLRDVHTLALPDGRLIRWYPDVDQLYRFRSPDQAGESRIGVAATICEGNRGELCRKINEVWGVDVRTTATSSAVVLDKRL